MRGESPRSIRAQTPGPAATQGGRLVRAAWATPAAAPEQVDTRGWRDTQAAMDTRALAEAHRVPGALRELAVAVCNAACTTGRICCGGGCVNPQNDPMNCGHCGNRCEGATPYCVAGSCGPAPWSPTARGLRSAGNRRRHTKPVRAGPPHSATASSSRSQLRGQWLMIRVNRWPIFCDAVARVSFYPVAAGGLPGTLAPTLDRLGCVLSVEGNLLECFVLAGMTRPGPSVAGKVALVFSSRGGTIRGGCPSARPRVGGALQAG
jgi:hypothetical protein